MSAVLNYLSTHWTSNLSLLGGALEIIGAILIANRYVTRIKWHHVPGVMLSSLWGSKASRNAAVIADVTAEKNLISIQGLALLTLGFICTAIPNFHASISNAKEIVQPAVATQNGSATGAIAADPQAPPGAALAIPSETTEAPVALPAGSPN